MEKGQLHPEEPDGESYEFISDRDMSSIRSDSSDVKSTSSTDSGIPLSVAEKALAERIRHLQQENKDLRKAIENYQKALELCQDGLNDVITRQDTTLSSTREKYCQAKLAATRQNEKIASLKKQLQEEKDKNSRNGEAIQGEERKKENNDCNQVEVSGENNSKEMVSSVRQFVGSIFAQSPDDYKTCMSPDLLQELIDLSKDMEKYIKPLIKSDNPPSERKSTLEYELESVKEQLKQEENKRAEVETRNTELQKLLANKQVNQTYVQELQEELMLMKNEVEKIDRLRAGYISRDSQTEDSSYVRQTSQQSADNPLSSKNEVKDTQAMRKRMDTLERNYLAEKEEKKELLEKLKATDALEKENNALKEELEEMKANLDGKPDENEFAEALATKNKIQQELLDEKCKCEEMQEQLSLYASVKEQLETKINENDSKYFQELKMKETMESDLKAQVFTLCEEINAKEMEIEELKASINLSETECDKINSAFNELRKELDAVYSENERLLTERKVESEAEVDKLRTKLDNLTAQLLGAEEMLEHKETDLRKLQEDNKSIASELETVPLLKQQLDVFQADFNTERQTRQKVEDDNRKLRNEVAKLQADNERLKEELNDPTGSNLAEMQRRHNFGIGSMPGTDSAWSGFYDQFLAPRGPAGRSTQPPPNSDMNRQVSGGRCPKCNVMFQDLDTLQTHVVRCLESESTGSVGENICPKCQESFPDLDTLQIHVMECLDN